MAITFQGNSRLPILVPVESDFLLVINTTLLTEDYWSNLHFRQGVPLFNTPNPKLRTMKFGVKTLETSLYCVV